MKAEWVGGPYDGYEVDLPDSTLTVELFAERSASDPKVDDKPWAVIDLMYSPSAGKFTIPYYRARRVDG